MSAAVGVRELGPWSGSLQLRYLGPRPLVEDGSVRARSTVLANARIGYRFNKWVDVFFDVFNLTDRKANDIEYYYTSRLPGEPPEGIDDLHVHPVEPRTFRLSARVRF